MQEARRDKVERMVLQEAEARKALMENKGWRDNAVNREPRDHMVTTVYQGLLVSLVLMDELVKPVWTDKLDYKARVDFRVLLVMMGQWELLDRMEERDHPEHEEYKGRWDKSDTWERQVVLVCRELTVVQEKGENKDHLERKEETELMADLPKMARKVLLDLLGVLVNEVIKEKVALPVLMAHGEMPVFLDRLDCLE